MAKRFMGVSVVLGVGGVVSMVLMVVLVSKLGRVVAGDTRRQQAFFPVL